MVIPPLCVLPGILCCSYKGYFFFSRGDFELLTQCNLPLNLYLQKKERRTEEYARLTMTKEENAMGCFIVDPHADDHSYNQYSLFNVHIISLQAQHPISLSIILLPLFVKESLRESFFQYSLNHTQ